MKPRPQDGAPEIIADLASEAAAMAHSLRGSFLVYEGNRDQVTADLSKQLAAFYGNAVYTLRAIVAR
ncbi:hypothetical protein H0I76_13190 [Limibaculum sp. M0105]|uniref:Uncharacterized protein n=1 Tax=Thermohalobaculum xanthum TaxID=2753746 RepID=A0A8J7M9E0_9RHOB|nr:hypothetical protein [Thermohalobaculum xanthum]MBK0400147.1 hypothetical protein [Thermohalobaculum xanthum]